MNARQLRKLLKGVPNSTEVIFETRPVNGQADASFGIDEAVVRENWIVLVSVDPIPDPRQ